MIDVMFTFVDDDGIGRFIDARVAVLPRQGDRVKVSDVKGIVYRVVHDIDANSHGIEIELADVIILGDN